MKAATMTMPTFAEVYKGLFISPGELGSWGVRPESFGLALEDALVEVCDLCQWQDCDRCSIHAGDWQQVGPPALEKLLDAEVYYDGLPTRERTRNWGEEEPETVEFIAGAVVKQRMGTLQVIVPRYCTMRDAAPKDESKDEQSKIDAEVDNHRAFKRVNEEAPMEDGNGTLVLYCDGGRRGDGTTYGSVKVNGQIVRREWGRIDGPTGSSNSAEYKALINALYLARKTVERMAVRPALVEIRMDSELVRNQVLGLWRCKAPHLIPLRDQAIQERDALLKALRRSRGDLSRLRLEHIDEAEMKRVIGH